MSSLTDRLAALPTAAVSDALDALGLPGALHGIGPLTAAATAAARAAGPAFTVRYEPITGEPGTVGDFLDDVPAGAVVVIDNAGRTDCTVWGGIMTTVAAINGVAGTVVHGACRDVAAAVAAGYPLFGAGRFMRTGKGRVRCVAVQQPVLVGGVPIAPGDLIAADGDGVVAVAAAHLAAVVARAEHIDQSERRIVQAVRAGRPLARARAELGYHALQSRGPVTAMPDETDDAGHPMPPGMPAARGHATATLYEASGLDIAVAPALRAAWPGAKLAGPAFTVRGAGGDNLALHRAVAAAPPGHVLVADHQGAQHGHWGEILAVAAQVRGLLGLIIDGAVRDVDELRRLGFPVFSRGISITRTGKKHPGGLTAPATVGGIEVHTGDLVVADADGVVAIPAGQVERVLDAADLRAATERRHLRALRAGATTLDLYELGGTTTAIKPTPDEDDHE